MQMALGKAWNRSSASARAIYSQVWWWKHYGLGAHDNFWPWRCLMWHFFNKGFFFFTKAFNAWLLRHLQTVVELILIPRLLTRSFWTWDVVPWRLEVIDLTMLRSTAKLKIYLRPGLRLERCAKVVLLILDTVERPKAKSFVTFSTD